MKRSRLLVALVAAGVSMTLIGSPSSFATSSPREPGRESVPGPVIDPEQQILDAQASQAQSNGVLSDAPNPGYKAGSPVTDLKNFPKFTADQLAERVQEEEAVGELGATGEVPDSDHTSDVESTEILADGAIAVTTYTPAPGVTPEELAEELRQDGETNVEVVEHEQEHHRAAGDCSYGYARSITCPVSFWANHSFEDPRVRFNDHSSASWPLTNAVYKWNQTPNIDSYYLSNSCPFQAGARCVDVYSGYYDTSWVGLATRAYDPGAPIYGRFAEQGHYIQLNDKFSPTTYGFTRNNVVTHEVGHILGLGHNTVASDVLHATANSTEALGGQNPVLLSSIYSVAR